MKTDNLSRIITELTEYALMCGMIEEADIAFCTNSLMGIFGVSDYAKTECDKERRPLDKILDDACDIALSLGLIENDSVVYRDLFDTKLMGALTPRPSEVIRRFRELYSRSAEEATDYFYALACNSNYIRRDRIVRDLKWTYASDFGEMDITVNLSKPEKDPKAIAAAKLLPQSGYPKCALCHENEGYFGTLSAAPRQNLRQIPFTMGGERWFLQYSPYVYYNEHCIALSENHTPMRIDESSFKKLLGFVTEFPHYFIGSNADLPIVGGSILSHDHMQGGRYSFAMERAGIERRVEFSGFDGIEAGILNWPMSVIRLTGADTSLMISLASKILDAWRAYSDPDAGVFAETDGEPHNTITPIARRVGELYQLDLVLRNNITTDEHPLGVFHPHAEHHNIKKENIGLIEVMGLAVLPSRLKEELQIMREAILSDRPFDSDERIAKHSAWFEAFRGEYEFTADNTDGILRSEIGKTFVRVLTDAGVFKTDRAGRAAFMKFIAAVNG